MSHLPTSRIQLDPAAINALLEQFVNTSAPAKVSFVDGRLHVVTEIGLSLVVESLTLDAAGLEVQWRVAGKD